MANYLSVTQQRPASIVSSGSSYDDTPPPSIVNHSDLESCRWSYSADPDGEHEDAFATSSVPVAGSGSSTTQSDHYPETPRTSHELVRSTGVATITAAFEKEDDEHVRLDGTYAAAPISPARRIVLDYSSSQRELELARQPKWQGLNVSAIDRLRIKAFTPSIATTTRSGKSVVSMKGTHLDPRVYSKVGVDGMVRWKIKKIRKISLAPWEEQGCDEEAIEVPSSIRTRPATKRVFETPINVDTTTPMRSLGVPRPSAPRRRNSTGSDRSGYSTYTDARSGSPEPPKLPSTVASLPPRLEVTQQRTSRWVLDTIASVKQTGFGPMVTKHNRIVDKEKEGAEGRYDRRIERLDLRLDDDCGFFGSASRIPRTTSAYQVYPHMDHHLPALPTSQTLPSLSSIYRPPLVSTNLQRQSESTVYRPAPRSLSFASLRLLFRRKSAPQLRRPVVAVSSPCAVSNTYNAQRASFKSNRTGFHSSWLSDDSELAGGGFVESAQQPEEGEARRNTVSCSQKVRALEELYQQFSADEGVRLRRISSRRSLVGGVRAASPVL